MGAPSADPRSGRQVRLRAAGYEAVVASVGATLRVLADARGDLIASFDADEERPAMRGALLAPWPNRTDGGHYEFGGVEHLLPINEPERGNAAHGLIAWLDFAVVSESDGEAALSRILDPGPGYPWRIRFDVTFRLDERGLTQSILSTNLGERSAPLGIGGHPYVLAAPSTPGAIDAWNLEVPAEEVLTVSIDRLLPVATAGVEVDGGALDFRSPRELGETTINHAFGALQRDADGLARVRVTDADGIGVEVAFA